MHKYSEYSIFTYMPKVLKFAEVYRENLLSYFKLCPPWSWCHDVNKFKWCKRPNHSKQIFIYQIWWEFFPSCARNVHKYFTKITVYPVYLFNTLSCFDVSGTKDFRSHSRLCFLIIMKSSCIRATFVVSTWNFNW